jgi:hypothetical protein
VDKISSWLTKFSQEFFGYYGLGDGKWIKTPPKFLGFSSPPKKTL